MILRPWDDDAPSPSFIRPEPTSGNVPGVNRQQASAIAPWASNDDGPSQMPSSIFGGSYFGNDSNDNLGQISPGFPPGNGMGYPDDDRRPSVASGGTVSSSGSVNGGGRASKKLQGFFGEEYQTPANERGNERGSRQNSEASSMKGGVFSSFMPGSGARHRQNSTPDAVHPSGPPSPTSSRPRTPAPSSEVTPWVFQDTSVSHVRDRSRFLFESFVKSCNY